MKKKKRFYVYAHYVDKKLMYIGKGVFDRAIDNVPRNKLWTEATEKGYEYKVIAEDLSEKTAYLIERAVISTLSNEELVNISKPKGIVRPAYLVKPKKKHTSPKENNNIKKTKEENLQILYKRIEKFTPTPYENELISKRRVNCTDEELVLREKAIMKKSKIKDIQRTIDRVTTL